MKDVVAIILGAGKGVRMKSDLPKVYHKLAGKPRVEHVTEAVKKAGVGQVYVVVGHMKHIIKDHFKGRDDIHFVDQDQQLGTGHAVQMVEPLLNGFDGQVVVLAGDVPLIRPETIKMLIDCNVSQQASATDLTAKLEDAGNYGRIVRKANGEIVKIVEKKDASPDELKIQEINTGTFCFNAKDLFAALKEVKAENVQKEYYLTDTIEILKSKGKHVYAHLTDRPDEVLGVNTKDELAHLESLMGSR